MTILTRDEILEVSDIQIELVEVPEWSGDVYVKGMTGQERDQFEDSMIKRTKKGSFSKVSLADLRAKLCSLTICDADGKLLFTLRDVHALSRKSAAALQRVYIVAQELSGITDEDVEDFAEVLEESPFDASVSD